MAKIRKNWTREEWQIPKQQNGKKCYKRQCCDDLIEKEVKEKEYDPSVFDID